VDATGKSQAKKSRVRGKRGALWPASPFKASQRFPYHNYQEVCAHEQAEFLLLLLYLSQKDIIQDAYHVALRFAKYVLHSLSAKSGLEFSTNAPGRISAAQAVTTRISANGYTLQKLV
jgi:hypothetical protein